MQQKTLTKLLNAPNYCTVLALFVLLKQYFLYFIFLIADMIINMYNGWPAKMNFGFSGSPCVFTPNKFVELSLTSRKSREMDKQCLHLGHNGTR
jgi:hypothetical protein